jgi:hypothetical protein
MAETKKRRKKTETYPLERQLLASNNWDVLMGRLAGLGSGWSDYPLQLIQQKRKLADIGLTTSDVCTVPKASCLTCSKPAQTKL